MTKLSFVDEARTLSKHPRKQDHCKLQRFLNELPAKARAEIQEALDTPARLVQSSAINRVLKGRYPEWTGGDTMITDHRNQRCCCVRG